MLAQAGSPGWQDARGALPLIKPNMTGAGRRVGFRGQGPCSIFSLLAVTRNSLVNLAAQAE